MPRTAAAKMETKTIKLTTIEFIVFGVLFLTWIAWIRLAINKADIAALSGELCCDPN